MSVYLSSTIGYGIHRYVSGEWGLHPPKSDRNNISYTWSTIEAFLDDCEVERQPVSKLYKRLEEPPIGLRSGPMPILLCAVLLHYEAEIALYEDGSFVTDVSIAVFERLIRSPEKFELKRFRMSGIRIRGILAILDTNIQTVAGDREAKPARSRQTPPCVSSPNYRVIRCSPKN